MPALVIKAEGIQAVEIVQHKRQGSQVPEPSSSARIFLLERVKLNLEAFDLVDFERFKVALIDFFRNFNTIVSGA
jgi:hypothetical protein